MEGSVVYLSVFFNPQIILNAITEPTRGVLEISLLVSKLKLLSNLRRIYRWRIISYRFNEFNCSSIYTSTDSDDQDADDDDVDDEQHLERVCIRTTSAKRRA